MISSFQSKGYAFTRAKSGVFRTIQFGPSASVWPSTTAAGWLGYFSPTTDQSAGDSEVGFVSHPDGYGFTFSLKTAFSGCSAAATQTQAMNVAGSVTGSYFAFCPSYRAGYFVMNPEGKVSVFAAPGKLGTAGMAINAAGEITGGVVDSTGMHGFVRTPYGTVTTFDPPESDANHSTSPSGISDAGVITGYYARHGIAGCPRIAYSHRIPACH